MAEEFMGANTKQERKPATLRYTTEARVAGYCLAAGAAMVAAHPAQAEIVFTPNHTSMAQGTFFVDLNHDGLIDIAIKDGFFYSSRFPYAYLSAYGRQASNGVAVIVGDSAAALTDNDLVGSDHIFQKKAQMTRDLGIDSGPWKYGFNRCLGVKFLIRGEVHYGWIGFRKANGLHGIITAQFYGWAYETEPNKPIRAGDMGHGEVFSGKPTPPETPEFTVLELLSSGHLGAAELRRRQALASAGQNARSTK
jgi:hypothetical protein